MPAYGGQVPVCMRCGDRDIRQQSVGDGLWPAGGEGVAWVCDACGHIGAPLLVDPREAGALERRWADELDRTAAELDEETWTQASPTGGAAPGAAPGAGTRIVATTFLTLGALFLLPGLIEFTQALVAGSAWAAVRVLVGTGWLAAIGLVLFVVGLRLLNPAAPIPREEPEASI